MNKLLTASIILATTVVAQAESLEERKFWKGEMDYINRGLEDGEKTCGVKFTWEWVDKPKLRAAAEKEGTSPYAMCDNVLQEVIGICREGDDEKASVKAKIKGFQCGSGKPRKLDLSAKGILKYMGNIEEANFSDWAKPWLLKKL